VKKLATIPFTSLPEHPAGASAGESIGASVVVDESVAPVSLATGASVVVDVSLPPPASEPGGVSPPSLEHAPMMIAALAHSDAPRNPAQFRILQH